MDLTSLIEIIIVIVAIYFFLRFIVSPIIKTILGIVIFLFLVYLLQKYFGFSIDKVLAPFGISFNMSNWNLNLDWLLGPLNALMDKIMSVITPLFNNIPKSINK